MRVDVAITIWPRFPERVDYLETSVRAFQKYAGAEGLEVAYLVGCETEKADPEQVNRVFALCNHMGMQFVPNNEAAHLGRNVNNLMEHSDAPYLFYLQEDFELLQPFDLAAGVALMERDPNIDVVRYNWRAPVDHRTPLDENFVFINTRSKKNLDFHPRLQRKTFIARFGRYVETGSAEINMSGVIRTQLIDKVQIAAYIPGEGRMGDDLFTHIGHQTSMLEKYKMHRIDDHIEKPSVRFNFSDSGEEHTPLRRWAFGIVANPETTNLEVCITNVIKAGFNRPYVFADTPVEHPQVKAGPFYWQPRCREFGMTPNLISALREMVLHQPGAQAYGLTTSDVHLMPRTQIKLFLERTLWPALNVAFVVLNASNGKPGWQHLTSEFWPKQACYIFPRDSLLDMLEDTHIRKLASCKNAPLGHAFFNWAGREKRTIFSTSPHLARDITGDASPNYLGDIVQPLV